MKLNGIIKDGVVVLDAPLDLPEGTRVSVEVADGEAQPGDWVKDFAGAVQDMPEDASVNYHNALYGTRKR